MFILCFLASWAGMQKAADFQDAGLQQLPDHPAPPSSSPPLVDHPAPPSSSPPLLDHPAPPSSSSPLVGHPAPPPSTMGRSKNSLADMDKMRREIKQLQEKRATAMMNEVVDLQRERDTALGRVKLLKQALEGDLMVPANYGHTDHSFKI